MTNAYYWISAAVIASVTIVIRFLPFLIFKNGQKTPKLVEKLGRLLPYSVMGMLVVYCLKGISFRAFPFGMPEILAVGVVVLMHLWKRNTLLSIVSGTVIYMVLVQLVF